MGAIRLRNQPNGGPFGKFSDIEGAEKLRKWPFWRNKRQNIDKFEILYVLSPGDDREILVLLRDSRNHFQADCDDELLSEERIGKLYWQPTCRWRKNKRLTTQLQMDKLG